MLPKCFGWLLVAALLVCAPAAHADSIVYAKEGNVWVSAGDGSGQRPVTTGGGYQYPSQADDGTIVAKRGLDLVRMDRQGRILNTIDTPAGGPVIGPYTPGLSPDGTKVAYWVGVSAAYTDPTTGISFKTLGSFVLYHDARTGALLGITNFMKYPSWLPDSSRALLFDEGGAASPQVWVGAVGQSHNDILGWFRDSQTHPADDPTIRPIGAGELSPRGDKLAVLRGGDWMCCSLAHGPGNHIAFYTVTGFEQLPTQKPCYLGQATGGMFNVVTWAPDDARLAWDEGDGIWTGTMSPDTCFEGGKPKLLIPGGSYPDWGPAEPGVGAPPPPPVTPTPTPTPPPAPAPTRSLTVRATAVRGELKVTVSGPAVKGTLEVMNGRRRVARKRVELAAGTHTVRVTLPRSARGKQLTVKLAGAKTAVRAKR